MHIPKGAVAPVNRGWRRRPVVRLEFYLLAILRNSGGEWVGCPPYAKLAEYLGYAISTISGAFRELEDDPDCPIDFYSGNTGPGGTRQKMAALKSWLDKGPEGHDRMPLLRREDGGSRGIRKSFRKGEMPVSGTAPESPSEAVTNFDFTESPYIERTTSADKPEPAEAGLSGCVPEGMSLLDYYMSLPADYDISLIPPPPQKPLSPNALAWLHAKMALKDGELFYDNRKPVMPVASLRALLLPAFERGMSWERIVRPALLWALRQAHAAACLGQVWNPGGMAAAIFREKLGLRSPRHRRRCRIRESAPPPQGESRRGNITGIPARTLQPPSVNHAAVRAQAGMLAAMMRQALSKSS